MDRMLSPIGGPPAWRGRELEHRGFWPRKFLGLELEALDEALARATASPPALRAQGFAIPALRPLLETLARELETGAGVIRLSGLPVERLRARAEGMPFSMLSAAAPSSFTSPINSPVVFCGSGVPRLAQKPPNRVRSLVWV